MNHRILIVLASAMALIHVAIAAPPKVVITSPDNGETDVSPDLKEIRVEFDQPMNPAGSIVGGGENFPEIAGDMKWPNDKTIVIPVTLKPDHPYQLSINSDTFKGFRSKAGEPAEWYPISFHTAPQAPSPQHRT